MRRRSISLKNSLKTSTAPSVKSSLKKPSKYRAKKTVIDGIKFDSLKEGKRYGQLKLLLRAGEISDLQVHPSFDLKVNNFLICRYIADFSYYKTTPIRTNGKVDAVSRDEDDFVVEDVKGMKKGGAWDIFRIKAKLMKAVLGIDVVVI